MDSYSIKLINNRDADDVVYYDAVTDDPNWAIERAFEFSESLTKAGGDYTVVIDDELRLHADLHAKWK